MASGSIMAFKHKFDAIKLHLLPSSIVKIIEDKISTRSQTFHKNNPLGFPDFPEGKLECPCHQLTNSEN